jgi:putative Holliday junction resolvase
MPGMPDKSRVEGRGLRAEELAPVPHSASSISSTDNQSSTSDVAQPAALSPQPSLITILGFDYGARRIGVAVGNRLTSSARALEVVNNGAQGADWQRLDALLREWHPQLLLVGLPLTMNGDEQANSRAARAFATALQERYDTPAQMVDERLSSREAAQRFAEGRARGESRRKHAQNLDAVAAAIIVETWLNHPSPT